MPLSSSCGLHTIVSPSSTLLSQVRVWNNKGVAVEQDKGVRAFVLRLRGDVGTTRVQMPRDDRPISSLSISHPLLVAQVLLDNREHFALELTISQSAVARIKLVVGTQFREAQDGGSSEGMPLLKLPLIIPRGKWVQVVLHLTGIVSSIFNKGPFKCIDAVGFCGTGRVAKVFSSNDEQTAIDSAPTGMVLFAVPAYAPPIWLTAAASAPGGGTLTGPAPSHQQQQQQSYADQSKTSQAHNHQHGGQGLLPEMGVMGISLSGSNTSANEATRGQSVPPRLQPIDPAMHTEMMRPHSESGGASLANINWPGSDVVAHSTLPPQHSFAPPSQHKYIRFVEKDDSSQRTQARGTSNQTGGGGCNRQVSTADASDISGWEVGDDESVSQTDNPGSSPFVPTPPKTDARAPKQPSKPKNATDERVQRLIASRKRKVEAPTASRRPVRGSGDDDSPSPGQRRRLRAKRRMQLMRQNELKAAKQNAMRFAMASEIGLNRNVSNFEDGTARKVEDGEPVCGYGFGYLGLLHEDGSFETDEGANTHLKGALTLELSGDFDSDE